MDDDWDDSPPSPLSPASPTMPAASALPDSVKMLPPPRHTISSLRPNNPRSATEPTPSSAQTFFVSSTTGPRPPSSHGRNKSPYSRSHLRSRSGGSAPSFSAPPMMRAHSMPTVSTMRLSDKTQAPAQSPMRISTRLRSPSKALAEDYNQYNPSPRSPGYFDGISAIESIQEDSELQLPPRSSQLTQFAPLRSSSLQRRRPASPLYHSQSAPTSAGFPASIIEQNANVTVSGASSGASSPALGPQRYNESYPSLHHYASTSSFSSMPSTPTSARSRSPSISSLDTIEDEPDLESEAVEQEREERLKIAAERAERAERGEDEEDSRRRRSLDTPRQGFGFGRGGGLSRERKRWSVCGGERRTDLDLETIWED